MHLNTNMLNFINQIFQAAESGNEAEVSRLRLLAEDEFIKTHFPSHEVSAELKDMAHFKLNAVLAFLSKKSQF